MAAIKYHKTTLKNGLRLIVHTDHSTPLAAVSLLYNVGSRNEDETKTGYAHLFEHLMFGGSLNAPSYDNPIQLAGGESNAFTNSDVTNFYCTIPSENLETVLWLESDRMANLALNERALEIQRDVVVEEFNETSINQPYGDLWHLLSKMAYQVHPYKWPTIGIEPAHIQDATLEDVQSFYRSFYGPNNAILVLTGNVTEANAIFLVEKWFGQIPARPMPIQKIPKELPQNALRREKHTRPVSADILYLAFHMCDRNHSDYPIIDMLSDVLASGKSSFLYQRLLKKRRVCNSIDAYITGTFDDGLFIVEARPAAGISLHQLEEAIWEELDGMTNIQVDENVLVKLKNKIENSIEFGGTNVLHKAMNLAYYEWIGRPNLINSEYDCYKDITKEEIQRVAQQVLRRENCNVLEYCKEKVS